MTTNLNKELETLMQRRTDLQRDLGRAAEAVEAQKNRAASDLLAGRDNAAGLDALGREQLKAGALQAAIAQADAEIDKLRAEIELEARAEHQKIFDGVLAQTEDAIIEGLAKFYALVAALNLIDERFRELAEAGQPYRPEIQHYDPAKILMDVRGLLMLTTSGHDATTAIRTIETEKSYSSFAERARARIKV